ncbi:serine hydrolase [Aridibaculum aurantiacum]|uniref:serine hydrolase n=1 Tax=Aridibaculum aurantiacum TaxID=2810307 RepID=UPI001A96E2B6|nr:serine hydrolase [Aridibaculum aurantiacum]
MKKQLYTTIKKFFVSGLFVILFYQSSAQGFSTQTDQQLKAVLQQFYDPSMVGGISVAIKVDGVAMWQGVVGYASQNTDVGFPQPPVEVLEAGDAFRMYSVTKTFTASLVLELARQKVFNLDDQITKWVPVSALQAQGLNTNVTIRQLLAHESGYSDYVTNPAILAAVGLDLSRVWQPLEILPFVSQNTITARQYSSTNYILLGHIIEQATGQTVQQLFRTRFIQPLQLQSVYLDVREQKPAGLTLASPHENLQLFGVPLPVPVVANVGVFPFTAIGSLAFTGGGMIGNAADMAEWGNSLYGGRVIHKKSLDAMISSISNTPDADDDYLGYGIFSNNKVSTTERFYGHNGSGPGYRALMWYQPDRKMTIAILSNTSQVDVWPLAKALFEALPVFMCGNKDDKLVVCQNGIERCIARAAAGNAVRNGAVLGGCDASGRDAFTQVSPANHQLAMQANLKLYPNPAKDVAMLQINAVSAGDALVNIYDLSGRHITTVFNGRLVQGETKQLRLDTRKMSNGVYLVNIVTAAGTSQHKLIVNR